MYIHRVILKGVPGIPDRDLTFFDDWTGKPLQSVLLTGPNGTGKTTLLRTIAALWEKLDKWLRFPQVPGQPSDTPEVLHFTDLAAIEIHGLIDQPLWVYEAWNDNARAKAIIESEARQSDGAVIGGIQGAMTSGEELTRESWFKTLALSAQRLQLGANAPGEMLPNMVFLESDTRQLPIPDPNHNIFQPEALYRWLVTYSGIERGELHLENMLKRFRLRDQNLYEDTLRQINLFLKQNGKQVTELDSNLRLKVETPGYLGSHYIDRLSSGEQQCLILIFMISRWLMPGGIVLVDEPDLHLHGSWQRSLIHQMERLVAEKNGQLIISSHSALVVEEYRDAQRFHLEPEAQHS